MLNEEMSAAAVFEMTKHRSHPRFVPLGKVCGLPEVICHAPVPAEHCPPAAVLDRYDQSCDAPVGKVKVGVATMAPDSL